MDFKVLGPFEVTREGKAVLLSSGRQVVVLALLLLEADNVVSVARLIDALWDDDPPRTAKSQVQITVSALRQILGEDIIATRQPGYMIKLRDEHFDLVQFGALTARAAHSVAEQRLSDAVDELRMALSLWRGKAIEGVERRVIQAAAMRLNERRTSVLQDCLDLELRLGRHHEIIGELTELVAQHPLDERFRAQLMLAFYRAGRQVDALQTFRVGRTILQEELGLDPGQELRHLEQAILTQDPQLDLPGDTVSVHAPGNSVAPPIPRQLPRTISDLTGRDGELKELCQILTGENVPTAPLGVPIVVLAGRGGVGKTALAVRAAHVLQAHFPDGQLFLQLRNDISQSASSLLDSQLRSVGISPDMVPNSPDGLEGMYRSWLANRRVLVVIDGAVSSSQVLPLLPGAQGCAAIVTSRRHFASLEGASHLDVGPLDHLSASSLLLTLIGEARFRAEEQSARELVRLCEGLPLALRIAAAKLVSREYWRIGYMVNQLLKEERRLDGLELDGAGVRTTLALSYESLETEARRLLRRLSLLGTEDFPFWVGAPLLDQSIGATEELLNMLVRSHLVETRIAKDGTVRFHLHDLVRIYASECLLNEESVSGRLDVMQRLLQYWLSMARIAHRQIYGGDFGVLHGTVPDWPPAAEAIDAVREDPAGWFRRERSGLVSAIYSACRLNLDELAWELAAISATLFESGFYSKDWRETHASALDVVRRTRNRRGEAALLYSLGTLELTMRSSTSSEYLQRSLEIFEEIDDAQGRAYALVGLAFTCRLMGDYDRALANYEEALTGFQHRADLAGMAYVLKTMAKIHAERLDFEVAEQLITQSLNMCYDLNTPRLTAQAQYELAEIRRRMGQLDAAAEGFKAALSLSRETDDVIGQGYALTELGNVRRELGDIPGAEAALGLARDLVGPTEDRLIRARVLLAVAELDCVRNKSNLALAEIDEALGLLRQLGSAEVLQARALEILGRLHKSAGRTEMAEHAWQSAVDLVGDSDKVLGAELAAELARLQTGS